MKKFGWFLGVMVLAIVLAGCGSSLVIRPVSTSDSLVLTNTGIIVFRVVREDLKTLRIGRTLEIVLENLQKTLLIRDSVDLTPLDFNFTENSLLFAVEMSEGVGYFDKIIITSDADTIHYVRVPSNSFKVQPGKIVYIGDIVVKSEIKISGLKIQSSKYWFTFDAEFEDVKELLKKKYPKLIAATYPIEEYLIASQPRYDISPDLRTIDISQVEIVSAQGTRNQPVTIFLPFKNPAPGESVEEAFTNLFSLMTAACYSYISSLYGEEGKDWELMREDRSLLVEKSIISWTIKKKKDNTSAKVYFLLKVQPEEQKEEKKQEKKKK